MQNSATSYSDTYSLTDNQSNSVLNCGFFVSIGYCSHYSWRIEYSLE